MKTNRTDNPVISANERIKFALTAAGFHRTWIQEIRSVGCKVSCYLSYANKSTVPLLLQEWTDGSVEVYHPLVKKNDLEETVRAIAALGT